MNDRINISIGSCGHLMVYEDMQWVTYQCTVIQCHTCDQRPHLDSNQDRQRREWMRDE